MSDAVTTLDPDRLAAFIGELRLAGFTPQDDEGRRFEGPLAASLAPFTHATTMTIVISDGWPYVRPNVVVTDIDWWHAPHGSPCLWQTGDNTKRWLTLKGIVERLDEWAQHAANGFTGLDGAALDPHLYFEQYQPEIVGIDVEALVDGLAQDGQHNVIHLDSGPGGMPIIAPGMVNGAGLRGRWFYRTTIAAPPTSLTAFETVLTDKQRTRLNKIVATQGHGLFVLIWPTPHGLSPLALYITEADGQPRRADSLRLTPLSRADRLRRAGPDAEALAAKRVVLFGVGAIGSHLGSLLARSGLGYLTVVDSDEMTPAILVRHAATTVGIPKVGAFKSLVVGFEWTAVDPIARTTWLPDELADLIEGTDLCIDATGDSLFAELLSRVAGNRQVPMVSVALFRGGRVVRVRRQAAGDHPIVHRTGHWRYPPIPVGLDRPGDFVGTETGCTAPIHNAPPTSVIAAAALGAAVAIDQLTGRANQPDEIIDVLQPIEAPFDRLGRFRREPPAVMLTDEARSTMVAAAAAMHPCETGGILIGVTDPTGAPCIVQGIEVRPAEPSKTSYVVPVVVIRAFTDRTQNVPTAPDTVPNADCVHRRRVGRADHSPERLPKEQ